MEDCPNRLIRIRTVLEMTGISRSTLYRKIDEGRFPCQIKIAERCCAWREAEVREWLRDPSAYRSDPD